MSPRNGDYEGEELSGNKVDDDDDLNIEGLDDIRLACMPSTVEADDDHDRLYTYAAECSGGATAVSSVHIDDDGEGDFELARNIMNRYSGDVGKDALRTVTDSDDDLADRELLQSIEKKYSVKLDVSQPISMQPLSSIPPAMVDDDEDDFETLRAIEMRFRAYDKNKAETPLREPVSDTSYEGTSDKLLSSNVPYDLLDARRAADLLAETAETSEIHASSHLPRTRSQFPLAAQFIIDAIKKNRSSQKFLRTKLIQMESKIEENSELRKRLEALKDFQTLCRKRTGHALSLKKDPRVQLISVKKINLKKASVMHYGPEENVHVANYKKVLGSCPLSFVRKKWSKEEKENLGKGIRQEFQEMLTQVSLEMFSLDGSSGDINDFDNVLASIKDFEITPEHIREFLPKVNWDKLASKYVVGRSGAECEARWLNCDDPLINQSSWNSEEDKTLLNIVSKKGPRNWFEIAESLSTGRTPFQCLLRYQRSLNPSMLNKEWTNEEDDKLRTAVQRFGENDWQSVATAVENRTGAQCSNRWKKSLFPQRKGSFSPDEDKRVKIGIMFFGKKWEKIAQYIPGRTGAQCRDRYVNSLDPELRWDAWSEEEDARLIAALEKHKFCWSKIAKEVDKRTDGQCRKRWMKLFPEDVPKLQEAKKRQKTSLISNFVDREAERPAYSLDSFLPSSMLCSEPESDNLRKRRERNTSKIARLKSKQCDKQTKSGLKKSRTRERKKHVENRSGEQLITSNEIEPYNDAPVVDHDGGLHSGNNVIIAVPDNCLTPQDTELVNNKQAHIARKKTRTRKCKKCNENYSCEQHVGASNEIEPYSDATIVEESDSLRKRRERNASKVERLKSRQCDKQTQNGLKKSRTRERKKRDENHSGEQLITSNEIEPYNDAPVVDRAGGPHSRNNVIIAVPDNCLSPQDAELVNDEQAHNARKKTGTRKRKKCNENNSCEQLVIAANELEPYSDATIVEEAVGRHPGNNSIIAVPDNCLIPPDAALVKDKQQISELGGCGKKKTSNLKSRKKKSTILPLEVHGSLLSSNPEPVAINGAYVEPHCNNLAEEREGASKENFHANLCAKETNSLQLTESVSYRSLQFQNDQLGSLGKKKTSNLKSRKKKSTILPLEIHDSLLSSNPEPAAKNGVYVEPQEERQGASKGNCPEKLCTKATRENSLWLTESVICSNLQRQNDHRFCLDATNEEEVISNVLDDTSREGCFQRQNEHMVMGDSGSHVFSSPTKVSEMRMTDDVLNNFLQRNISEECEVFYVRREHEITGALENQSCEPMHSEALLEGLSEKTRETPFGDDVSLACFLQNRLKKKRIKLSENCAQTGNRMPTGTGNHVSLTCRLNESPDTLSHASFQSDEWTARSICEPSGLKQSNNETPLLRDQKAVNMGIGSENGELPLVYLLGRKLKKRLQADSKNGRPSCPSSGEGSGLLIDAEVRCNGDNSKTFSQFAKEKKGYHGKITEMLQVHNQQPNSSTKKACDIDKDGSTLVEKNSAVQHDTVEKPMNINMKGLGADLSDATTSLKTYQRRGKGGNNGCLQGRLFKYLDAPDGSCFQSS